MAKVKIKTVCDCEIPKYQNKNSTCVDILSNEDIVIRPNRHELVKTGISVELPEGSAMLIFPRSSLGTVGLMMANSVGVVDCDYKGEILINLYNTSYKSIAIKKGQKIGQGMMIKPCQIEFVPVKNLSDSSKSE